MFVGGAGTENLHICSVIDAFEDDFRSNTIELFCEQFLQIYDRDFKDFNLTKTKERFIWFKNRLNFYNKQYSHAFPPEWRMQFYISLTFSQKTKDHFRYLFNVTHPDAETYLEAFELSSKFEKKMSQLFITVEEIPFDSNSEMPIFPRTSEGIRQRYEWLQRQQSGLPDIRRNIASEFLGSICSAFAPHVGIFLKSEIQKLNGNLQNKNFTVDERDHIITSYPGLIHSLKSSLSKCSGFGISSANIEFFQAIKAILQKYINSLSKSIKKKSLAYLCAVANTSNLVNLVLDSLLTFVNSIVSQSSMVSIDDIKEQIGLEIKTQIIFLADFFCERNSNRIFLN